MATWGGSTAGNLESIEEDENDSGDGQEVEDEDDGKLLSYKCLQWETNRYVCRSKIVK